MAVNFALFLAIGAVIADNGEDHASSVRHSMGWRPLYPSSDLMPIADFSFPQLPAEVHDSPIVEIGKITEPDV